jgi:XTP/dITP diphosphohydrolase
MNSSLTRILLATHNRHKAGEFQDLLKGLGIGIETLDMFPQVGEIAEDADTLRGNALAKAREVCRLTGVPSMGDDTGLEVGYLHDEPGVFSSRYAGPGATYADNVRKLLNNLRGVPPRRRGARFRCVLALVLPDGREEFAEGVCRGVIIEEPRGINGFGYDPVFLPEHCALTFAEMDAALKNSISHRARAINDMKEILSGILLPVKGR